MPELVVLNGVAAGTVFALGDVPAVVGRSPEAHLQVGDPWISSMHAMFERRDDGMWVVDLESRNGVFLGGDRVGEARLTEGAVVRLGRTEIRFSLLRTCTAEFARIRTDMASPPLEGKAARDGTLSTQLPLAREREDPYGLALRSATVLRMAIDAVDEGTHLESERVRAAVEAAAGAALEAGGVVARLAGVGVLTLFGLGGPDPQDAATALAAARAARAAVRAVGGLDLRAAVESGQVLAGNTGGAGGFELTALGPAAERAERLLAFARRGEIVAGPSAGTAAGLRPDGLYRSGDLELELFRDLGG